MSRPQAPGQARRQKPLVGQLERRWPVVRGRISGAQAVRGGWSVARQAGSVTQPRLLRAGQVSHHGRRPGGVGHGRSGQAKSHRGPGRDSQADSVTQKPADAVGPHIRRADPTFQMPSRAGSSRHKAVLRPAGSGRPASLPRPARGRDSRPGCSRHGPASLGRLSPRSRDVVEPPHRGISQKAGQSDTGGLSQSATARRAQMGSGQPDAVDGPRQTRPVRPGCRQPGMGGRSVSQLWSGRPITRCWALRHP